MVVVRSVRFSQTPVEKEHHDQKTDRGNCGNRFVWLIVCQIGLCGSTGVDNNLTDLFASFTFYVAKWQGHDMSHRDGTHGCLYMKGGNVGAHEACDVQKHAKNGKSHSVPAVGKNSLCLGKIKLYTKYFPHDAPDVVKWHKSNESADPGEDHRKYSQVLVATCKNKQLV